MSGTAKTERRLTVIGPRNKQQVLEMWEHQYRNPDGSWGSTISGPADKTFKQLQACRTTAQMDKLLGGGGWVNNWCSACKDYFPFVISIGSDDTQELCRDCIEEAMRLIRKAERDA